MPLTTWAEIGLPIHIEYKVTIMQNVTTNGATMRFE